MQIAAWIHTVSLSFCFFLFSTTLTAGNENYATGARGQALGNASVTFHDVFAVYSNQAGLAYLEKPAVGIYGSRRFFIGTANLGSLAAALPTKTGVFGLTATYFGYEKYNDKKVGIGFAKLFGDRFAAGLQFDYLSTYIQEYGTRGILTFEAGVQADLTEHLRIGAHVFNPVRAKLADFQDERVPAIFKLGLGYQPIDQLLITIETEKDIDFKPRFKAGVEYQVIEQLYLRGGVATNPLFTNFGTGVHFHRFQIDLAVSVHQQLGYSPHLSIRYQFGKRLYQKEEKEIEAKPKEEE